METRPYISWELAENFMVDAFQAVGVPEADARICADVLLESDRRGIESHGCNRFKPIYMDRILNGTLKPVTEIEGYTNHSGDGCPRRNGNGGKP